MKAREVLSRYANGERNFRNANLRGQSFKGQDLSGADFSGADIRSANFTDAVLRETNFSGAKAGLQRRWILIHVVASFVLSVSLTFTTASILSNYISSFANFDTSRSDIAIASFIVQLVFLFSYFTIFIYEFTIKTIGIITTTAGLSIAVALSISLIVVKSTLSLAIKNWFSLFVVAAVGGSFAFAVALTSIITVASAVAIFVSNGIYVGIASLLGFISTIFIATFSVTTFYFAVKVDEQLVTSIVAYPGLFSSIGVNILLLILGFYIALHASIEDKRFSVPLTISIAFGAIGGTSFSGADLSKSDFSGAVLGNTNFQASWKHPTNISYIRLKGAKKLSRARVGNTILMQPAVRELLVSRNGYRKSYRQASLAYADLSGINLNEADLQFANLNGAILQQADLRGANLQEALLLGADLKNASLTGACIAAWGIASNTNLEAVDCQYVYRLHNKQERYPSSGNFAPGDFTKLFQEVINTVDFIFHNGLNRKALYASIKQVQVENEEMALEVKSFENLGDGLVVVRVSVPPEADKGKIHSRITRNYEDKIKVLEARLEERKRHTTFLENLAMQQVSQRPTVEVKAIAGSHSMNNSNDQSQNISVGRDMNLSGSTLNLGEISGSVTNTISQLQASSPEAAQLADLLKQLQTAIETETDQSLTDDDKAEALEQLNTLAKAVKNPPTDITKKSANTAIKILRGTIAALPDTAKLAEACSKLLPAVVSLLGL
jgi:uncharacterized protein YjbI with pentapeptide repeats